MVILNSRDRPENIWRLKRMHLDKQCYKNQCEKPTYLSAITTALAMLAISSFKQAKCCNICPLENFKKFGQDYVSSTSQPVNRN